MRAIRRSTRQSTHTLLVPHKTKQRYGVAYSSGALPLHPPGKIVLKSYRIENLNCGILFMPSGHLFAALNVAF